ncbi:cation transport protein-domain-containing protein [Lentinula lateritia]|uniref:Cation transport protein-domain-containing protein n=1 Tax=Lentinula aff. lateritia TaxID=2804960 RepID=A0ACC1TUB2_9AGAR|nr:cation transport protein-domain-containing protein [Lentinula aff. lateritia]KAJ3854730.1 cation transport protein-domain-containing protein [Lentinula lateritia]
MLPSIRRHLNFYRIHILFLQVFIRLTFTPLIFSAIFYASNGRYKISYIDALFNCVSAMTVCGLATLDLSSLTPWQQVILFTQMCLGSPVRITPKFEHIIESVAASKEVPASSVSEERSAVVRWCRLLVSLLNSSNKERLPMTRHDSTESFGEKGRKTSKKLRTDMIRRMDDAPKLVNPSGWISEGDSIPIARFATINSPIQPSSRGQFHPSANPPDNQPPVKGAASLHRFDTVAPKGSKFPRTPTVEFSTTLPRRRARIEPLHEEEGLARPTISPLQPDDRRSLRRMSLPSHPLMTSHTYSTYKSTRGTKHSGFGGFPMPHEILQKLFDKFFPKLRHKLTRTITIPITTTIASQRGGNIPPGAKVVPYISFEAVVGRNSAFPLLSDEQLEELGGVEYRALNALLWIVGAYHIGIQLVSFVVIASYMSISKWNNDFLPPALHRPVSSTWFSLYQTVSAYTNTGTSLVDTSMIPFQKAYPVIVFMVILILAGNTALRAEIFFLSKIVPRSSRLHETLQFLLDHPRRCFIYLFPSHQTWFLLIVVIALNVTDWLSFMVLDIGTPAIDAIPVGVRLIIGVLQAVAVRAAGFGTVTLSALAPAVKVLYVIMMYISVCNVRSTNVYEEQSLGVYRESMIADEDPDFQLSGPRMTVWSKYLAMHARKQLSFDMWWLGLALFLVCIIERPNLDDTSKATWFNIFNIVFELTSAYGTVGLSLGIPTANYSFSGAFRPLSKLIVCLVMLRGRHRGLPVAIDRAVMLPSESQCVDIDGNV